MSKELDELIKLFDSMTDNSASQIPIFEEMARLADSENNIEYSYTARSYIIYLSICYDDGIKAVLNFPKYLSISDNNFDKINKWEDGKLAEDILWSIKLAIEGFSSNYQIQKEKVELLKEELNKRCIEYGYSLKPYYQIQTEHSMDAEDKLGAKHYFKKFELSPRDDGSDCVECEYVFKIKYELFFDNYDRALVLTEMLYNVKRTCHSAYHFLYDNYLEYYMNKGMLEKAEEARKKSIRVLGRSEGKRFFGFTGNHFTYFAITNPKKGISLFTKYIKYALNSNCGRDKFKFYLGAWMLWESLKKENSNKEYKLILPNKIPFYNEDGKYTADILIDFCSEHTVNIGNKFDHRDKNNRREEHIRKIRKLVFKDDKI